MVPPPPATFSTMKVCSSARPSWSATVRPIRSRPPPGCAGTMIFTVLAGYACACRQDGTSAVASARLAAKSSEIHLAIEGLLGESEKPVRERSVPAAIGGVAAELALDILARQRLVHAAADMRLAFLEHASVLERHFHVAGIARRVRIVRVYAVAHLGRQPEDALVGHGALAECLETRVAGDEGDGDVERGAELGRVVVRRPLLVVERLPKPVHVALGGFAQHLGDLLNGEAALCEAQRAVDVGLVHGAGGVGLESEARHMPVLAEIMGQLFVSGLAIP